MPRITDFEGFSVVKTKRTPLTQTVGAVLCEAKSHQVSTEEFNPFAGDTITPLQKKKTTEPVVIPQDLLADARTRPAVALRQTIAAAAPVAPVAVATEEEKKEDEPFVSLFPAPAVSNVLLGAATTESSIPMIQPRNKEGQRLLYRHPLCPRVGPKRAYWMLVGQSDRSAEAWLMQFDGGANPNPGPASAGAVLWTPMGIDGKRSVAFEAGKFLGKATNNIGEAQGLLLGLQIAATRGARELLIEGDSELIVFQQTGQYKVSNANLKRWWAEIQAAMMDETCFDWIAIRQVPRELNERADSITKEVLVKKSNFTRA